MEEVNKKYLQKAVKELKGYQPPKSLWHNIEHGLDATAENPLKVAIEDLPNFQPNIPFESIAQKLGSEEKQSTQIYLKKYWMGIAAAITLLFVSIQFFIPQLDIEYKERITYSESEEVLPQAIAIGNTLKDLNQEDEVYQIIIKHCEASKIKCKNPEFQTLLDQYVALNVEKDTLFSEIQNKQQEALMLPHIVRIEKERSKVGKMLIQLLLS